LVFDSGVGGLSIAAEIQKKIPFISIIYASDNAFFPYGTKGEAELIDRVEKVLGAINTAHPVDLIVIACNTASTLTLPHCRQHFTLPIVGVVPAIKPAAQLSKTGVIGLLATPATIARPYTHDLINEYAPNSIVISLGSSELVTLAEKKLRGEILDELNLDRILAPFFNHPDAIKMDTVVLACTHFPLIREDILASLIRIAPASSPKDFLLIDSGEAIARRVEGLLLSLPVLGAHQTVSQTASQHLAIFTKASRDIEDLKPALAGFGFNQIEYMDLAID